MLETSGIEKISPIGPPALSKEGQGVPMVRVELTIMPSHAWGLKKIVIIPLQKRSVQALFFSLEHFRKRKLWSMRCNDRAG